MKKDIASLVWFFGWALIFVFCPSRTASAITPDLVEDGYIDGADLGAFAAQWLATNCANSNWCEGADFNHSGQVDFADFSILAAKWNTYSDPYPQDGLTTAYMAAAEYILKQQGVSTRGYCMAFGCGQGRLAYELTIRSDLTVLGCDSNQAAVDSGRAILEAADSYGEQITLQHGDLNNLNYRNYAAVLVVSDSIIANGTCSGSAAEMFRMVRPAGGMAIIGQPPGCPNALSSSALRAWLDTAGLTYTITDDSNGVWARIVRDPLPGEGQWINEWADLGNTACSGDSRITNSWKVLWFGDPGPRELVDRHSGTETSLYKNGRLVIPGENHVFCVDAYNGAKLWDVNVPDSSRIGMPRDAGFITMDSEDVFIAAEPNCRKIDLNSGAIVATYSVPTSVSNMDWGYLAIDGNSLLGSTQIRGASVIGPVVGDSYGYAQSDGYGAEVITSKSLFCMDKNSGALLWTYDQTKSLNGNDFVIANPAICIGGGAIYFIESYNAGALSSVNGRVDPSVFLSGNTTYIVKLDENTGNLIWRVQRNFPYQPLIHLSYANNILLVSGSDISVSPFYYRLYAYNPANGNLVWSNSVSGGTSLQHGTSDRHPMIIGNTIQLPCGSFDLLTGVSKGFTFAPGNCADASASLNYIFARYDTAQIISLSGPSNSHGTALSSQMRPGCYISIIPAGGLILMPAYSSGCTCAHAIQTSVAWLPQ
jgi:outer membrane protein assembly factor BamB